jgi:hypothetical protein
VELVAILNMVVVDRIFGREAAVDIVIITRILKQVRDDDALT